MRLQSATRNREILQGRSRLAKFHGQQEHPDRFWNCELCGRIYKKADTERKQAAKVKKHMGSTACVRTQVKTSNAELKANNAELKTNNAEFKTSNVELNTSNAEPECPRATPANVDITRPLMCRVCGLCYSNTHPDLSDNGRTCSPLERAKYEPVKLLAREGASDSPSSSSTKTKQCPICEAWLSSGSSLTAHQRSKKCQAAKAAQAAKARLRMMVSLPRADVMRVLHHRVHPVRTLTHRRRFFCDYSSSDYI